MLAWRVTLTAEAQCKGPHNHIARFQSTSQQVVKPSITIHAQEALFKTVLFFISSEEP